MLYIMLSPERSPHYEAHCSRSVGCRGMAVQVLNSGMTEAGRAMAPTPRQDQDPLALAERFWPNPGTWEARVMNIAFTRHHVNFALLVTLYAGGNLQPASRYYARCYLYGILYCEYLNMIYISHLE